MTRDEIENMPAGRELDALIAEKVFGCHPRKLSDYYFCGCGNDPNKAPHGNPKTGEFSYSTDISAAWGVVDYMYSQTVQAVYVRFKSELKYLTAEQVMPSWIMSLAICRAALLATMK